MFQMQIDGIEYAAKSYYSITPSPDGPGDIPIPNSENELHIRADVMKQLLATDIVRHFFIAVKNSNVSCVDVQVAETKMVVITSTGLSNGQAFLIDHYFGAGSFVKYSGTTQAGRNTDLYGKTCDAIAHFSLDSTGGNMVLVDIQGVRVPKLVNGNYVADELILFDLMFHT